MNLLRRLLELLASLRVAVVGMLLLTVLTIWGTLYQADNGLYQAQERFYQSWFFLVFGWLPFPGAQTVMTVLLVNLAASIWFMQVRGRLTLGFLATHVGLLLLLVAGAVTFYGGHNASLSLEEGEASSVALSPQDWELALLPNHERAQRMVSALPVGSLRAGQTLLLPDGRTRLRVEQTYRNCSAERGGAVEVPRSSGDYATLRRLPSETEAEDNRPGLLISLTDGERSLGRVLLWGGDPNPVRVELPDGPRGFSLRRQRLPLPATIELVDFRQELHPGTSMARSYSSEVLVRTGGVMERRVTVAMNKPLRLQDFTFYQSSFARSPGGREVSTFAVVQNRGRVVPYVATTLTGCGMALHFLAMLWRRVRQHAGASS